MDVCIYSQDLPTGRYLDTSQSFIVSTACNLEI